MIASGLTIYLVYPIKKYSGYTKLFPLDPFDDQTRDPYHAFLDRFEAGLEDVTMHRDPREARWWGPVHGRCVLLVENDLERWISIEACEQGNVRVTLGKRAALDVERIEGLISRITR